MPSPVLSGFRRGGSASKASFAVVLCCGGVILHVWVRRAWDFCVSCAFRYDIVYGSYESCSPGLGVTRVGVDYGRCGRSQRWGRGRNSRGTGYCELADIGVFCHYWRTRLLRRSRLRTHSVASRGAVFWGGLSKALS